MNFLDFFFPKKCGVCEKEGKRLCRDCLGKLKLTEQKCPMCCQRSLGGVTHKRCETSLGLDGLKALWSYRQIEVRKLIKAVKYKFSQEIVGEIFKLVQIKRQEVNLIVPLPLNRQRENWRGFNQASTIAKELGRQWGIEVTDLLIRVKNTKPLAEIKNSKLRKAVIKGAFMINPKLNIQISKMRILLVDDVFTSGATMREATKILKRAGANRVWGWTLAN
jgi:ComF family protein